jgi:hypothetical protein
MKNSDPGESDEIERNLIAFVRERRVWKTGDVTLHSEIYKDLGINGMDAYEIGVHLNKRYGTDFSRLNWNDHVPGEPWLGVDQLLWLWRRATGHGPVVFKSLTVGRLVDAVRRGEWAPSSVSADGSGAAG